MRFCFCCPRENSEDTEKTSKPTVPPSIAKNDPNTSLPNGKSSNPKPNSESLAPLQEQSSQNFKPKINEPMPSSPQRYAGVNPHGAPKNESEASGQENSSIDGGKVGPKNEPDASRQEKSSNLKKDGGKTTMPTQSYVGPKNEPDASWQEKSSNLKKDGGKTTMSTQSSYLEPKNEADASWQEKPVNVPKPHHASKDGGKGTSKPTQSSYFESKNEYEERSSNVKPNHASKGGGPNFEPKNESSAASSQGRSSNIKPYDYDHANKDGGKATMPTQSSYFKPKNEPEPSWQEKSLDPKPYYANMDGEKASWQERSVNPKPYYANMDGEKASRKDESSEASWQERSLNPKPYAIKDGGKATMPLQFSHFEPKKGLETSLLQDNSNTRVYHGHEDGRKANSGHTTTMVVTVSATMVGGGRTSNHMGGGGGGGGDGYHGGGVW